MWSGYVYRIRCNITGENYYGSTESDIEKRIDDHVRHAKCDEMVNKCTSSQIIERGDWCCDIIEEVDYIIKVDLLIRERHYIENYPCINITIPYRTNEEKRKYHNLKQREYHINNANRLNEWFRIKHDCPCGGKYTNGSRAIHYKNEIRKRYIDNN